MVVRNVRENDGRVLLEVLDQLRKDAQGSTAITVRILTACDHDGVCAAKIFDILLKRAGVNATGIPVTGNTEIIEHIKDLKDSDVKSLVLLNCGASLDVQRHLEESKAPSELCCFIIDAHRPLLLANLSERNRRVFVLDDDPIVEEGLRPPVDDSDSEEEEEEEKENEYEFDQANPRAVADEGPERKRRRLMERAERQKERQRKINEYYLNSYFAMPAAMSLFKMARQAAQPSADLLWLAAVSLAGYQDLGLLGEVEYGQLANQELNDVLEEDVGFSDLRASQSSAGRSATDNAGSDDETAPSAMPKARTSAGGHQSLRFEKDLRLTLYKHWNLEESMMHSAYFYGTLELHRDKGLRSLKNFFAKAGIPPAQYKQQYAGMPLPVKKKLQQKFTEHGKGYGLNDKMLLQQFVRDLGSGDGFQALNLSEISAVDCVHIVTALLSSIPPSLGNAQVEQLPKTADGRRDADKVHEMERQAMVENFFRASDAVLLREPTVIRDGVVEAVNIAKAVQNMARFLIDTKALRLSTSHQFRWCKIEQTPNFFRHHLTVRRLGVWLLSVLFRYRPKSDGPEKPMLLILRDQVRDTYLCVGASPAHMCDQNEFGERFRTVLRTDKTLKVRYDFFDKSCIEVASDDFDRFWDIMVESIA
jgi:cell division control protein 45